MFRIIIGFVIGVLGVNSYAVDFSLADIQLPPGYRISIYAQGLPDARQMALGDNGIVYVGSFKSGDVVALIPTADNSKTADVKTIAKGLNSPNGVAYRNGALYVAETHRIIRFDNITSQLDTPPKPVVVKDNLPYRLASHYWKVIAFGPDDWLYVPIGAPCNVCLQEDQRFATIMRMKPDGRQFEIFARGIRNSVGLTWHPLTKELWFTDNGRDWLGDDLPPDELNRAPKKGLHFGFPYFYGNNHPDPVYGKLSIPDIYTPAAQSLDAHVAALGLVFISPTEVLIAEHGSWNRSKKSGYRITQVTLEGNKPISYQPFASGWLQQEKVSGRPVDIIQLPDKSLLVSDDFANVVYRISK